MRKIMRGGSACAIKVNNLVLLEANYYYELLSDDKRTRHAQCMLVFKDQSEEKSILLRKSVVIPLTLRCEDSQSASFLYDSEQLRKRIHLVSETSPDLMPYGVMVLNEGLYDYTNVIHQLYKDHSLRVLLEYKPQIDVRNELNLKVFSIAQHNKQLDFKKTDYQLEDTNIILDNEEDKKKENSLVEGRNINEEESEFVRRLIKEIDRMIKYLEVVENNNPEILRYISLLVTQLRKDATSDIEEEIMNKESEINALKIIFEQWEMSIL